VVGDRGKKKTLDCESEQKRRFILCEKKMQKGTMKTEIEKARECPQGIL